jgi:hypothetical protein
MLSSVQPSCAEITRNPTESNELESEPAHVNEGHDDVLRLISEGLAAEGEVAWRACFLVLKANQSFWTPYHRSSAVLSQHRIEYFPTMLQILL